MGGLVYIGQRKSGEKFIFVMSFQGMDNHRIISGVVSNFLFHDFQCFSSPILASSQGYWAGFILPIAESVK